MADKRKFKPLLGLALGAALAALVPAGPAAALDRARVEREIHRLTNQLRAEKGVAPLAPLPELDGLARRHSENMARKGFFSHTDPAGLSPSQRLASQLPQLYVMASGENIAMRTRGESELVAAKALMTQWRNSPGHYKNIVNPAYRHLGVGVAESGRDLYATQNFAAGLVIQEQPVPKQVSRNSPVTLRFRFLADFPREQLSAFVYVPDKAARIPVGNQRFYVGGAPATPQWLDARRFELRLSARYGLGRYRLGLGRSGSYFSTPFGFEAVAP